MRFLPLLVVGTILGALDPADAQQASAYDVNLAIRDGMSGTERLVIVTNRARIPIIVTQVRLTECENVQGGCIVRKLNQRVLAGAEVTLLRIRARSPDQPFGFRTAFSWKPEEGAEGPGEVPSSVDPPAPAVRSVAPSPPDTAPSGAAKLVADAIRADSMAEAAVVDTLRVLPETGLSLAVGQSVELGKVLRIQALNAAKEQIPGVRVRIRIDLGSDVVRLERGVLTGLAPGIAVLYFSPPPPAGVTGGEPKGGSRIVVKVN
ncbi:MAG: hypothetical protein JNJ80_10665 [Gemmatimonadetes bacterium]|nr:hypothetical protein [Gemmatimonadota bacterium]